MKALHTHSLNSTLILLIFNLINHNLLIFFSLNSTLILLISQVFPMILNVCSSLNSTLILLIWLCEIHHKFWCRTLNSTLILLISVPIHYYFFLSFSTLFCRPLTFSQKFLIFLLILFHLFLHFLRSFNCRPPHIFTLSEVDNFFTAKIQFYPLPYQEILCLTIFPDGF